MLTRLQACAPAAGARIAFASAICVNFNVTQRCLSGPMCDP
jgi:hypothetical protein